MIDIKTTEEIHVMKQGGKILADVLDVVLTHAKPGVTELELDQLAETMIRERGGEPGFRKVPGYHHAICISTNDVVVHGVPTAYRLKEGDVVGIDCGVFYKGFHTDMAETVKISNLKSQISKTENKTDMFLKTGKTALDEAVRIAKSGNRIGHISKTIQHVVEGAGYSVVRSLIGHGVGRKLHEEPQVPGFLDKKLSRTPKLTEGMTIAIEVIYNMGKPDVVYANDDGWTIKTQDGSLSGVFERTIAITRDAPLILTA